MTSEKEKIIPDRPTAVFIETSAFYNPVAKLKNPEWSQLKEIADLLKIKIYTSKLVVDELCQNSAEGIGSDLQRLNSISRSLNGYLFDDQQLDLPAAKREDIVAQFKDRLPRFIADVGIEVLPNFNVPMEKLLEMSVKKTPPFEAKGEKGFRDSIILFTAMEKAKEDKLRSLILVADDQGYRQEQVLSCAKDFVPQLLICSSLGEALGFLNNLLDRAVQKYLAAQEDELIRFISDKKNEIEEFIQNAVSFPPSFLMRDAPIYGTIQSIKSIQLKGVESAVFDRIPEKEYKGDVKVSCDVLVELNLDVEPFKFPQVRKLWVRGAKPAVPNLSGLSKLLADSLTGNTSVPMTTENKVLKKLRMQAFVYSEEQKYLNLRIESITPDLQMMDLFG